jgi:hypothetical protein
MEFMWDSVFGMNFFTSNMKLGGFYQLRTNLHIINNLEIPMNNKDVFVKIRPLMNLIKAKANSLSLEETLSVDEQMIPFKGSLNVKQYIKDKRTSWGVKVFCLAGKSELCYDTRVQIEPS